MYQDTDFGKEILEGAEQQTKKLGIKIVESTAHKPTDQDFTAIARQAALGRLRPHHHGHHRARLRSCPTRRRARPAEPTSTFWAPRRSTTWSSAPHRHGRLLRHGPHRDALRRQRRGLGQDLRRELQEEFNVDPNIGAVYGYVAADLTFQGLKNAGKDLTLDSFIKGLEAIKDYKDIFNGPQVTFGPNIRQGANSSFLAEVKNGRWNRVTQPLGF